jgi:glycerophosphoryl diester phosphodiesterase
VAFFDGRRPVVFAHRGGCALGPENTLVAFDLGMAAGADGLELDVHLSSDGVPVVHHDSTLDRTTSASGPLAARTAADLSRVDAGYHFAGRGDFPFRRQGIGVPTLGEVLRTHPDVPVTIEMKVDSREMGESVAREVRAAGAADRVCAAGFGACSAAAARAALPEMACSATRSEARLALYRMWARCPIGRARYGGYQVPERNNILRIVSRRFIRCAHESDVKVHVWTVDEEADMRRLFAWGVDGLISNRPDLAVRVRDACFPWLPGTIDQ